MKLTNCDDFVNCFKNHKNIINLIETGKQTKNPTQDYSLNTKKGLFQIIVWLIDNLQIPLTAFKIKIYNKLYTKIYYIKIIQKRHFYKTFNESLNKAVYFKLNKVTKNSENRLKFEQKLQKLQKYSQVTNDYDKLK